MQIRSIKLHGPIGFGRARQAGQLAAETLDFIAAYVKPGVSLNELDRLCQSYIEERDAIPAPLGYRGFPKANCISVNNVVCHGIPNESLLKDGDIVNIDVTPILNGWHGDSSRMYIAGTASTESVRLCDVTYECLMAGIAEVKPGNYIGDIGFVIQELAESNGFSVVREYSGHGIGEIFHDEPFIPHWGVRGTGIKLVPGMIFTIEPMLNFGKQYVRVLPDKWTVVTTDNSLSAQFEHMIGVTETGCEIFTRSPRGLDKPYSSTQ